MRIFTEKRRNPPKFAYYQWFTKNPRRELILTGIYANNSKLKYGEGGIRTLDTGINPYNGLANRRFRPLSHLSKICAVGNITVNLYIITKFYKLFLIYPQTLFFYLYNLHLQDKIKNSFLGLLPMG